MKSLHPKLTFVALCFIGSGHVDCCAQSSAATKIAAPPAKKDDAAAKSTPRHAPTSQRINPPTSSAQPTPSKSPIPIPQNTGVGPQKEQFTVAPLPVRQPAKARAIMMAALDSLVLKQDTEQAIQQLEAALKEDPALVEAHYNLGLIAAVKENWQEAASHFEQVMTLAPQSKWSLLAANYRYECRALAAIDASPQGKTLRQLDKWLDLAKYNLAKGEFREAARCAAEAVALDESQAEPYIMAARVMIAAGHIGRGRDFLTEALKRLPESQKPPVQAVADEIGKEYDYRTLLTEGKFELSQKKPSTAVRALSKANLLFPDRFEAVLPLSTALALSGDAEKAMALLNPFAANPDPRVRQSVQTHLALLEREQLRISLDQQLNKCLNGASGEGWTVSYFTSMYNPPMRSIKNAIERAFKNSKIETVGDSVTMTCINTADNYTAGEVLFSGNLGPKKSAAKYIRGGAFRAMDGFLTIRLSRTDGDYVQKLVEELSGIASKADISVTKGKAGSRNITARIPFNVKLFAGILDADYGLPEIESAFVWTRGDDPHYNFLATHKFSIPDQDKFLLTALE